MIAPGEKHKKRVLVVEDEQPLRQAMEIRLLQEGYRADTAANGREALAKMVQAQPNLILLDLVMPIMDGVDFLKALKVDEKASVPIVVLTVMTSGVLFEQCQLLGVKDYLVKDKTPLEEIIKKVKAIVGKA